ncbi:hypothetical protein HYPSUDRAFT_65119 [Hypholoma sublateritium FD-334 SS-4]|uniref:Uncharacterized protein n=1 Tax=Hypholoma sublateritium (strain FD-334 SS-4) TaxID=945553 RepID=A0A0D2LCY6_HYPSF|nr:hypothetical protein HYPSUDRAFT_65119 [Hypholoma sublateritium FD-334 SS-4]
MCVFPPSAIRPSRPFPLPAVPRPAQPTHRPQATHSIAVVVADCTAHAPATAADHTLCDLSN